MNNKKEKITVKETKYTKKDLEKIYEKYPNLRDPDNIKYVDIEGNEYFLRNSQLIPA